ncbi:hypothetical protein BJB45_08415 [Halomonas huangheensis]|uniref:Uncharacterized protein n=1 Tax=Halomonas huangheensis TaxID=1178482 RepID=W1NBH8_9GAMM|nr:hypothetical protein BJB45_08415 [Halomonas huangheensis]
MAMASPSQRQIAEGEQLSEEPIPAGDLLLALMLSSA